MTPSRDRWAGVRALLTGRRGERAGLDQLARRARDVERAAGVNHAGKAAVSCRPVSGPVFAAAREVLGTGPPNHAHVAHWEWDVDGEQWAVIEGSSFGELARCALSVASTLDERGFGSLVEWTVFALRDVDDHPLRLVYGHRRHTFHPVAPRAAGRRDSAVEEQVARALRRLLPLEPDPAQWVPLWHAPVGGPDG